MPQVETSPADEPPQGSGEPPHVDAEQVQQPLQAAADGLTRMDTTRLEARDLETNGAIVRVYIYNIYIYSSSYLQVFFYLDL